MKNIHIKIGGTKYTLGKFIAKGGECHIYKIGDTLAVKLYPPEKRASREEKIRAMVDSKIHESTSLVSYPIDLVTDLSGKFIGFSMKLIEKHEPLHHLYSPKSRQKYFPDCDYRFLIRVANNISRSIGAVHQTGTIIGDVNHSGILVGQDATVAIIDADSFQFRWKDKVYPCLVGVPEYTPPELQGCDLSKTERLNKHDNFGLAVAIFLLLFMGRHPFAGIYPRNINSLSEAIRNDLFAYSRQQNGKFAISPPKNALSLNDLPSDLAHEFEQAFNSTHEKRPTPLEWIQVLNKFENALSICTKSEKHFYPSNLKSCFWCSLEKATTIDMFPGGQNRKSHPLSNQNKTQSHKAPNTSRTSSTTSSSVPKKNDSNTLLWVMALIIIGLGFYASQSEPQRQTTTQSAPIQKNSKAAQPSTQNSIKPASNPAIAAPNKTSTPKTSSLSNPSEWQSLIKCPSFFNTQLVKDRIQLSFIHKVDGNSENAKFNLMDNKFAISVSLFNGDHSVLAQITNNSIQHVNYLHGKFNLDRTKIEAGSNECSLQLFKIQK